MWRWADVASLWLHQGNHFILFLDVVETGTVGEPPLELLQLVFHCIKPCYSGGDNMMVDYLLFHDCLVSGTNIGRSGQELSNATKVSDGCSPWLVNQPSLKTCCQLSSWHDRTCFWSETNTEISCQLLPDVGKSGERQTYLFICLSANGFWHFLESLSATLHYWSGMMSVSDKYTSLSTKYSERMNLNKCQQQSNNISFGCLFYISTRPAKTWTRRQRRV